MGFAEDLKTIANACNEPTLLCVGYNGVHDRREPCNRSCAEIVPVGEPAGKDHAVIALERCFSVPDVFNGLVEHILDCVISILVAVRAGKLDYRELHFTTSNR